MSENDVFQKMEPFLFEKLVSQILTDFNDIRWECTWLYLQQIGIGPIPFVIGYNICIGIMISETVNF